MRDTIHWARLLAFVPGLVNQELLLQNEYSAAENRILRHSMKVGQQIQTAGFYLSGFLCLALAVLKLTIEGHWSWWRVLIPL